MQKKTSPKPKDVRIKISDSLVFRKNPDMVTRKIEDETILVPIFRTSDELNCIYTLNESASRIWDMIDGENTVAGIKEKILKEFDTTVNETQKELLGLVKDLKGIKAVI